MYKQMKPKRFKTARRGSKRMQGISREVRVLDLQAAYGISENALQRKFTDLEGWMNQYIAQQADEVILMVSGISVKVKG